MDGLLADRVALVTGASSGIGAATALRLAAAGAHVVLAARRLDRLEALAAGIAGQGGSASALPLDVAHDADVAAAAGTLRDRHGRLDILVNAAGVMLLSPVAEADPAEWRRMVEINLIGLMQVTRAVLPLMPSGHGHVVNIASLAGRIANPGASGYAATKFGVVAFSESLRRELVGRRIRVTVVEPGVVVTELQEHVTHPAARATLLERMAAVESLEAEDVAAAVFYAVSQPPRVGVNEILLRPAGQER
ncbi:SDR family NAD(P)-dependent oxidoreductase [Labrys wisconsinensis]|uniref:NADP-dependent 3-hydroxy acid dehydrogenase YdfG n=1 Tax=Labrys wisconsinensis TaxID=425677 RepID=A0ABU0J9Q4_9HYPH|nr:SDR family NAD(P)-dependent oxidoreductase [Labrys wisconsinensis]MDQ0471006.1 NADP-dependent 3-hydroxy acid dehydrogenase YdfG [Labrys wisconsinensis]